MLEKDKSSSAVSEGKKKRLRKKKSLSTKTYISLEFSQLTPT